MPLWIGNGKVKWKYTACVLLDYVLNQSCLLRCMPSCGSWLILLILYNLSQVIADNVGDNVGDIAGMGSDLFGSYAESSCAALVVASISSFGINHEFTAMMFPLLISSVGIIVCLITTLFATDFFEIKAVEEIEPALKKQLVISTALMTVGIAIVSWIALPSKFTIFSFGTQKDVTNW